MNQTNKAQIHLLNKLGEGSYGTVYLVKDQNDAYYALKTIKIDPFLKQDQEIQVQISQHLNHPNIIKTFTKWSDDENLQILMEYCPGDHIRDYIIKKKQHLATEEKLNILRQIVEAGIEMNSHGIIHRDLKPENILLKGKETVKIIDFGCSKKIHPNSVHEPINESYDKGTTIYASPEELRSQAYSAKCDVWSIGCVAYELQYEEHPFKSQNSSQFLEQVTNPSVEDSITVSQFTDPRILEFIKLTLKEKEEERASWQELLLSRIFAPQIEKKEDFIAYLHTLSSVSKWMTKQILGIKDKLKGMKRILKLFLYFLARFQKSSLQTQIAILEDKSEISYLFSESSEPIKNIDTLRNAKHDFNRARQTLHNLDLTMKNKDYFQEVKKQFPKKRTSCFADIEYSIRFGKMLLKEVIDQPKCKNQWNIWSVLTKWVKFEKYMTFQMHPKVTKITNQVLNPEKWIKDELCLHQ